MKPVSVHPQIAKPSPLVSLRSAIRSRIGYVGTWIGIRMHTECTQRVGATLDKFTADSFDRWIDTIGHSLASLRFAQRSSIRTILHALAFFHSSMRSRIIRPGERNSRNTRIASRRSTRYSWIKNPARCTFAFLCIASTSYEEKRSSGLAGWISWMSCISRWLVERTNLPVFDFVHGVPLVRWLRERSRHVGSEKSHSGGEIVTEVPTV